eukprot:CAMPEP_0174983122 /NCGR_PEP_ID=MMETSP0004_2-20121128/16935_1 /TAXON_ID=420556 /ORGANISM="Ochromonas sp., Strain CCMP1393" /LENGTH=544 /DNA_ID=CAMNT_0016235273 /DNA_START=73 /DNA_END=1708 /DNA_ORIENTATION=+
MITFSLSITPKRFPTTGKSPNRHNRLFLSKLSDTTNENAAASNDLFAKRVPFQDLGVSQLLVSSLNSNNFKYATPIQQMSYSAIISGKDVVIGSETGSGKTLSYLLPLIEKYLSSIEGADRSDHSNRDFPSGIILAPNKELCWQIEYMASQLLAGLPDDIRSNCRIESATELINYWQCATDGGPFLLICTPRYLANFVRGPTIFEPELFENIRSLVLDEADMLLEGSYKKDVDTIFEALKLTRRALIREGHLEVHEKWTQFILSAATLPSFGLKSVQSFVNKKFPDAIIAKSENLHTHHPSISQRFIKMGDEIEVTSREHVELVIECILDSTVGSFENTDDADDGGHVDSSNSVVSVLAAVDSSHSIDSVHVAPVSNQNLDHLVMIFLNTAQAAKEFAQSMRDIMGSDPAMAGLGCVEFHNLLTAAEKRQSLEQFRRGAAKILVCTDSAARGLDLPAVRHVVQAQFALNVVQHLHRIGRASRAGRLGRASNFYRSDAAALVNSIMGVDADVTIALTDDNAANPVNATGSTIEAHLVGDAGFDGI